MKRSIIALSALMPALFLAACQSEPEAVTSESGGRAEGEVLGGTISDDMIALEQLRSQAPLAPREAPSAAAVDAQQPQVSGEGISQSAPDEAAGSASPAGE